MPGSSLKELAKELKIESHDAHSSIGDTSVTTEARIGTASRPPASERHTGSRDVVARPL